MKGKAVKSPEVVARCLELRAQGMMIREVAAEIGVAVSTVGAWLADPDGAKQRARRKCYGKACVDCGGPTDGSGGFKVQRERCNVCNGIWLHENPKWPRDRIVAAIQRWTFEHGEPPKAGQWQTSGEYWPASTIAQYHFGSWNAAIAAAGLTPRRIGCYGRPGEDPAVVAETVRLYRDEGLSGRAVAARMGCTNTTVFDRLRKAGVERRPPGRPRRMAVAA